MYGSALRTVPILCRQGQLMTMMNSPRDYDETIQMITLKVKYNFKLREILDYSFKDSLTLLTAFFVSLYALVFIS